MGYCPTSKESETLRHATPWMKLEQLQTRISSQLKTKEGKISEKKVGYYMQVPIQSNSYDSNGLISSYNGL
jgi:hypothetical protein